MEVHDTGASPLAHETGTSPLACLGMSLLAGLSTTLGAGVVFLVPGQRVAPAQMAFALALAGGVMVSVTLLEFWLPMLAGGKDPGPVIFCSLIGVGAFWGLSQLVPEPEMVEPKVDQVRDAQIDEECQTMGDIDADAEKVSDSELSNQTSSSVSKRRSVRLALVMMMSLTAHNFPEGFAVAVSATQDSRLGIVVMFAIAVHNVPEGIAIAVPVLAATGSRRKALWMSFLSGMAEPIGALTALIVMSMTNGGLSVESMENLLCVVGGVMCAVAFKELLPEACRLAKPRVVCAGMLLGFFIMWLTSKLGA